MKLSVIPEYIRKLILRRVRLAVFVGDVPSLAEEGIAVKMLEGNPNSVYFGEIPNMYEPMYQILIRVGDYTVGAASAQAVKDILDGYTDKNLQALTLVGSILYLGRSEQKMHEFQLTFTAIIKEE